MQHALDEMANGYLARSVGSDFVLVNQMREAGSLY
jgi:hypothetical protein